jgi:hypothetical protein
MKMKDTSENKNFLEFNYLTTKTNQIYIAVT